MNSKLTKKDLELLKIFSKSCRSSILEMTTNAASGHPGGALSCIDYLSLLYTKILKDTGEPIIVSNGHISPAVYAVLAEMGYIPKQKTIKGFRKIGQPYEGHVTRHVPGVWYGTGPLGAGISAAAGFAMSEKFKKTGKHIYALVGDGESQEGQVYEMMNFAHKFKLDNFIVFVDYNEVQLTSSLEEIMPIKPGEFFKTAGWHVIDVDGHDFEAMWKAVIEAQNTKGQPVAIIGHTIMGKGINFMEKTGKKYQSTWHGKAAKPEEAEKVLKAMKLTDKEEALIAKFKKTSKYKPKKNPFPKLLSKTKTKIGKPRLYQADELTDCRTAYGNALLDLAKLNENVLALTADVAGSVKTNIMQKEFPERHIECGISEQHMVSASGGLSLSGMLPFCSTFGAFMSSRAKDQVRVNDINHTNVKMVATHSGLSVGEDGPTHQAIDDSGSMLGFFNTMQIEPADPNQCDRIIRYIASHYGNFYVRMGRHKFPVLTKENGQPFFDENYKYEYGKCDVIRDGEEITIAAMGPMVTEALKAIEKIKENRGREIELIAVSSIKEFDKTLFNSIKKTRKLLIVEDHVSESGLASQISKVLLEKGIQLRKFKALGIAEYQLSGKWDELYESAGISAGHIEKACFGMLK